MNNRSSHRRGWKLKIEKGKSWGGFQLRVESNQAQLLWFWFWFNYGLR